MMGDIKKLLREKTKFLSQGKYLEAAEICNAIGNEYEILERYEEALEQHIEELEYCEITGDQLNIAVANRKIGESYAFLFKFEKAIKYIKKYYDIAVSQKSVVEQQRAHSTLGRTFYLKYQHDISCGTNDPRSKTLDHALLEYLKAYKLLHDLASDMKPEELAEMKCRLLLNMGLVYENRKEYVSCCNKIKEGMDLAVKYHLHEDIQRCGLSLGSIYYKTGNHQEANRSLNTALSAARKLNNKNMMCEILLSKSFVLISMEDFTSAKKYLKTAFKLHTSNAEDHDKIKKSLKVCSGICNAKNKLELSQTYLDKKNLLEKIADGLSSISCFKLAIKYYQLTVECMEKSNAVMAEKAPIFFSLARSYLDDDNVPKALEYFEKEFSCNEDKPAEQVKTLWEIADALEKVKQIEKTEEVYLKAVSIAEKTKIPKLHHNSLRKLLLFYQNTNQPKEAEAVQKKLNNVCADYSSEDETEEESPELFSDVDLSNLSDSDCEEITSHSRRRQTKTIESKVNVKGETPLHQACINGNITMVKKLVESGHSLNVRDYCGWTPLHEACNLGFYEIAEYLIEKGANINDPGGSQCGGITALHDAASCGNLDIMSLLISKNASVTAVDHNGETPLHALLQWKQRAEDLDDVTLRQCQAIESELRLKMREKGINVDNIIIAPTRTTKRHGDIELSCDGVGEKRTRSPSLSPKVHSDDEEDMDCLPVYADCSEPGDWEDATSARSEYKSVMKNLRRSAATTSNVNQPAPKPSNGPPLLNEREVVNDWLVKDTSSVKKVKRKRRKLNKLNVRTSKRIDDFLIAEDSASSMDITFNGGASEEDSSFSITSMGSVENNNETSSTNAVKNDISGVSFCVRVQIDGKLILVPVPDESKSISWLADEAAQRFQNLDGKMPHLTLTKNGALLSGSDLIKNIFCNNEEVLSVVDSWDEPSLEDRYVQLCNKRSNTTPSSAIKKILQYAESSAELNFSNCSISSLQFSVIFATISNFRSLVHLNVSGTVINEAIMKDFLHSVPCFVSLQILNMSCCGITSECLNRLTDYLKTKNSETVFPELKTVDFSYNCFTSNSDFLSLVSLSSLVSLNLSSCGLNASLFVNPTFCSALQNKCNLEDLNVSGNFLGETGISNYLRFLPKLSLKKLNLKHTVEENAHLGSKIFCFLDEVFPFLTELVLQGCHLTDIDIQQISLRLVNCPQLQVCDLSGNGALSAKAMIDFIVKAHENCPNITNVNVSGTCVWEDEHGPSLMNLLNLPSLKRFCIDNCSDSSSEKLIELWEKKWGNTADYFDFGCLDLNLI